jgi:medium-chain acyl-[acyl-carrier-protein] hydrolase
MHAFRDWEEQLPASFEVVVFSPPGRGARHEEIIPSTMAALVADILPDLLPELTMPFAFFGHSFGSWVAFELARELRRQSLPAPLALIASASPAPQLPLSTEKQISHLTGKDFLLAASERWGFIPPEFLEDPALAALMAPALKGDLALHDNYSYSPEEPLATVVIAYGGTEDHSVAREVPRPLPFLSDLPHLVSA